MGLESVAALLASIIVPLIEWLCTYGEVKHEVASTKDAAQVVHPGGDALPDLPDFGVLPRDQ